MRTAERKYGVYRGNIARWLEITVKERKKSNQPGRGKALLPELDEQLEQVLEICDLQVAISSQMLKQKVRLLITPLSSVPMAGWTNFHGLGNMDETPVYFHMVPRKTN